VPQASSTVRTTDWTMPLSIQTMINEQNFHRCAGYFRKNDSQGRQWHTYREYQSLKRLDDTLRLAIGGKRHLASCWVGAPNGTLTTINSNLSFSVCESTGLLVSSLAIVTVVLHRLPKLAIRERPGSSIDQ
jgi:hypothetical protein